MFSKQISCFQAGFSSETANLSCMENNAKTLTTTEFTWQERAEKAEAQVTILSQEMEYLKAQMRVLTAKLYGASSEKQKQEPSNQLSLFDSAFNEAEASTEPLVPEPELITVPAHKRTKSKGKKVKFLRACQRILLSTIFPRKTWFVRVAVMKDMLFVKT